MGSGQGAAVWRSKQAQSVARARGSGGAGQMSGVAHVSADAGEPRGCRFIGRLLCSGRWRAQHGGGVTVQVQAQSHRCRARWQNVRRQSCHGRCRDDVLRSVRYA